MRDPFETTPAGFHHRIEETLYELRTARPRRPMRWAAVVAMCVVLLGGTALALEHLGVWYFLTQRVWMGEAVDTSAIVQPTYQHCDSRLLDIKVRDAYWDGETLSIALHIQPKDDFAFYTETDVGQDGEHFDLIWWQGEVLSLEEWKNGRPELMLKLPRLLLDGQDISAGWDWVQNEQGETMLVEGHCDDMSQGATLVLVLECVMEQASESSALTFTLPSMKKGESKP